MYQSDFQCKTRKRFRLKEKVQSMPKVNKTFNPRPCKQLLLSKQLVLSTTNKTKTQDSRSKS